MGHIRVGKAQVSPDISAHTPGVAQGNATGNFEREAGFAPDGKADARRSTGVAPKKHNPILPIMPNLPPG